MLRTVQASGSFDEEWSVTGTDTFKAAAAVGMHIYSTNSDGKLYAFNEDNNTPDYIDF